MGRPIRHFVITDQQIRPGHDLKHIDWLSRCIVDLKPDLLVIIGDWADMASLSSYDKGKKSFEGRTYKADILAANDALRRLMAPIEVEQAKRIKGKQSRWNLRKVVTLGNHEHRIERAIECQRELHGLISTKDLFFDQWGFEVYPFLQPVVVDNIAYCHYFVSGQMGRPVTSARMLLTKHHMSCVAGHQQGKDIAYGKRPDGAPLLAAIMGSGYPHDEDYLNAQTNSVWKGVLVINDVTEGLDEMPLSLSYLERKYGKLCGVPPSPLAGNDGLGEQERSQNDRSVA